MTGRYYQKNIISIGTFQKFSTTTGTNKSKEGIRILKISYVKTYFKATRNYLATHIANIRYAIFGNIYHNVFLTRVISAIFHLTPPTIRRRQ